MLIKGIDYPEELLRAQMAGELVIFAGAGVSHPKPADLPLFEELADRIGAHSGVGREQDATKKEPDDRYLGRLAKREVKVHEKAAQILVGPHTRPHDLHQLLLRTFASARDVRLVTTNFDTHFSSAAAAAFDSPPETYFAPALPLGDDFTGLVYLHGCAGKDPKRCVMTDEDFGRAYITQAWASRFLAAMFSKYAVLFVGYSHNDTVMNYLARGLPPVVGKRRFVFTADESLSKWEFLGIHPMVYRLVDGENPHQAITESVGRWGTDLRSGLLEKAQRIRAIAESQPPLEGEDADYIHFALTQIDTARIFLKHARLPAWIGWLEKHGFIQPVFNPCAQLGQFERELTSWLTEHFFTNHVHDLWAAIQRNSGQLHPHLCWCVLRQLCMRDKDASVGDVLSRWVAVLLTQPHAVLRPDDWADLLTQCRFPEDKSASLLLFDHVTKPRVCLKESWRLWGETEDQSGKVDFDLNLLRDREHWVGEAWEHLFRPNLAAYANSLEPIVTANLTAAHALRALEREAGEDSDPFHLHRQSIEAHEQDGHPKTIDVLVDAAREILRHLLQTKPQEATALITKWFESDVPLLRRLAVHGYAQRADVSPDEKLRWLLANHLVYHFKTDVFWFLQRSFPLASEPARREFLASAMQGPVGGRFRQLEERTRAYAVFNLLVWLHRVAPECQHAHELLGRVKEQNPKFAPRECPELDSWSSGFKSIEPTEGFSFDRILTRPASVFLDELLAARPSTPFECSRSDYCATASAAVSRSHEWGIEWVKTLVSRGLADADLWTSVCQGWRTANLSPEQWRQVIELAGSVEAPPAFFEAFAEVLEHGARRERHSIPDSLMPLAQQVAERIWREALENSPLEVAMHRDWLATAINRPGGKLAEFWLRRVSVARKQAGDSWKQIPADIVDGLRLLIRGISDAAAHARVVLASQLHYFFSLDTQFAQTELSPLFDWRADPLKAEQCWHGFLFWGRWLPGLTEQLLPHFNETMNRAAELPDRVREALVNHIAGLALFGVENPLANGWIMKVVQKLAERDLERLAWTIDRLLDETELKTAEGIWARWLHEYWKLRLLGTPKPLIGKEANETACWALSLGSCFPGAVKLVATMGSSVSFKHTALIHRIDNKGLAKKYPDATADLVLLYLRSPLNYFHSDKHVTAVWQDLRSGGVAKEKLVQIREAMFRLGHDPGEP